MIKKDIINKIRDSHVCKGLLQAALNVAPATLTSYLDRNDIMLTTYAALEVIKKFIGVEDISEILELQEA